MIAQPSIPMSAAELPQQRMNAVIDLPPRPVPFDSIVGWDAVPPEARPKSGPRKAAFLGQVEWAWSPVHSRITSYYIHRTRKLWILWCQLYDENEGRWEWLSLGSVPLKQATEHEAAVHLLLEALTDEAKEEDLDHFHWINSAGQFSVEEWREIGRRAWE